MNQLALERIRAGIKVYFCVTSIMEIVPFSSKCLLLKNKAIVRWSYSMRLISLTTSSKMNKIFMRFLMKELRIGFILIVGVFPIY